MPVLQFKGKTAVECYHHTVPHHVLAFDPKLSVLAKGEKPGLDANLIIEGDNLLALKALLPTHAGRVKCIYIDPPYNTGNEGWVYNDNLTQPQFKEWIGQTVGKEGEDATRHDKWCCMMYPRLQLLKDLLRDDGVIFVSIDDNEIHNLRMLMDEIFGADNRLGSLVWKARNFPDTRPRTGVSVDHEYILAYRRTVNGRLTGKRRSEAKYSNPDNDPRGDWTSCSLLGKATKEQRPNLHYPLIDPKTGNVYPCPAETGWICSRATMEAKIEDSRILWPRKPSGRPREKVFLAELQSGVLGFPSVIDDILLLRDLIDQVAADGDTVLDSFAGSGTTGHAVLRLNKADGSKRRFVLIQMPYDTKENEHRDFNICARVTSERMRRVIRGYEFVAKRSSRHQRKAKERVEGLGGSFSYSRIGAPLFGEYRSFGAKLPCYEELTKYVFYTETSREFDAAVVNEEMGKIGEHKGTSYYLLYREDLGPPRRSGQVRGRDKTRGETYADSLRAQIGGRDAQEQLHGNP